MNQRGIDVRHQTNNNNADECSSMGSGGASYSSSPCSFTNCDLLINIYPALGFLGSMSSWGVS